MKPGNAVTHSGIDHIVTRIELRGFDTLEFWALLEAHEGKKLVSQRWVLYGPKGNDHE